MTFIASRARAWAEVRVVFGAGLVFTTAMLAATLLHLDRFHLGAGGVVARGVAWAWLVVYCLVPLATAMVLLKPSTDRHHPERSLPRPLRAALAAQAMLLLGLGVLLFARPTSEAWPWTLTPLTGRATAAWLLGLGAAALLMAREADATGCRAPLVAFGLLPVLELVALARYGSTVEWSGTAVWPFLAFLASMLVVGFFGSLAAGANGLTQRRSQDDRIPFQG